MVKFPKALNSSSGRVEVFLAVVACAEMARTVWSVLEATAGKYPELPSLQQPLGGGKYRTWSWREYRDTVRQLAVGLRTLGVAAGEMVGLASETRAEFYLADLAVMSAGAIAAAVYTSLPHAQQARALEVAGARVVFVENAKAMRALEAAAGEVSADDSPGAAREFRWILLNGEVEGCLTLEALRMRGEKELLRDPGAFQRISAEFDDTATAVLYPTSGATGEPKMGLVTHRAIVSNLDMGPYVLPLTSADRTIAFLPSAHIAQRVVVELLPAHDGACVYFSESLQKLPQEMRTVRPTFFLAPPRVWERMYSSITAEIKKRPAAVRRLFYMGVGLGSEAARLREQGKSAPGWMRTALRFFDKVMFSKIRERLGGQVRVAASGAAPLGKDLAQFFAAIGMPLIEGYGLTEGGVATFNPLDRPKSGSIGKLLPGVEARLEEDGELMLRSACLFSGYLNDPEATAAVLRDGWLGTGDIAEMDGDGYLYITGRKKELIVSSNGKKIYPNRIEHLLKRESLISHVVLAGDRLPYVAALITVSGPAGEAAQAVEAAVKAANRELASFEQVRKFRILDREFSIEFGELTPTMKIRRNRVLENHRALVSEMYVGRDVD
jgi:long-chain acyl-CoA synthetase